MEHAKTTLRDAAVELACRGLRPMEIAEALDHPVRSISTYLSRARTAGIVVPRYAPGRPRTYGVVR